MTAVRGAKKVGETMTMKSENVAKQFVFLCNLSFAKLTSFFTYAVQRMLVQHAQDGLTCNSTRHRAAVVILMHVAILFCCNFSCAELTNFLTYA